MSYILEALKKAQAERQLGSSPTIHAPTLQTAAASTAAGRFSKSMLLAAVIGVLLVLVMRPASVPAVAPAPVAAVAPAPVFATVTPTPLPAPVADLPPSVANLARASVPEAQPQAQQAPAAKPAAVPEEPVVNQRDLPEPIQRSIPQVAVGGYIYSKNPADRLLLVDKVLRHEGEEVAPGLVLEKLQPKEAVFSFKGYRYRVPY
ncbi:GspB domain-containing protein [Duganella sp. CY15W]|uniref:general secretion pathway protein GspB n=1 Tax=Duganella sp. CY15W TaxID=2692172 RepID=UPI0013694D3F|nr:general secretion pathway protein GspB [Duganella sp. CY15W]MYM32679.1 GspB domain-containing protein [Duganella sp. CY15W]